MNRWILPLYVTLLRLYPAAFRERFGEEMQYVFAQAWDAVQQRGQLTQVRFFIREVSGLLWGAVRARLALTDARTLWDDFFSLRVIFPLLIALALISAGWTSLVYWGYLFRPPSSTNTTRPFVQVERISYVRYAEGYQPQVIPIEDLPLRKVVDYPPTRVLPQVARHARDTQSNQPLGDNLRDEIAIFLTNQSIDHASTWVQPTTYPRYCALSTRQCVDDFRDIPTEDCCSWRNGIRYVDNGDVLEIWPIVDDAASIAAGTTIFTGETHTHRITPTDARYFRYHLPSGFVVRGLDKHGDALLLINVATYLSGDHYGYDEFLLVGHASGWQLRAHNSYQYDIAGIEGLTFPWLTLMTFVAFSVIALAVASIWQILKSVIRLVILLSPRRSPFSRT